MGRLGNQMFQYAAIRSLSKKFNYEYCLPINPKYDNEGYNLFECFKLDNELRSNTDFYKIEASDLGFDENIFNRCPDNVDLQGYFQDIRYFENYSEDIKRCFTFTDEVFEQAHQIFNSIFSNDGVISLHVRRGDYLNYPDSFPTQTETYYSSALEFFDKDLKVLIFSDDIEWAQSKSIFTGSRFFFATNNSNAVDLCLQTFCNYHIIANSSFSWWGAWLSNSKGVVKPTPWFGPAIPNGKNFLDVPEWRVISSN
jgi:hypothetical protein